jgi:hypothetical protein
MIEPDILQSEAGELEGRAQVAKLSRRKRDGVTYTPDSIVTYLVEETLGRWFAEAKALCGYPRADDEALSPEALTAYVERLKAVRIIDPACGAGAFLIPALRRLLAERVAAAREIARKEGRQGAIDEALLIAEIRRDNIYGVDIDPAAVDNARLSLSLHAAQPGSPPPSLQHTIRVGNALVGEDFWTDRPRAPHDEARVRAFDWRAAFPEVWPHGQDGGFDVVLGNPPYVKLQNLIKVSPDVADWLTAPRGDDTYASAQSGNFDLYLPFIEKGLRLLAPGGRMGLIAPSQWPVNRSGEGLRSVIRSGRHLDRWLDFKAHQVFGDVVTYTSLQFFSRDPCEVVRIAAAPNGEMAGIDWSDAALAVPYASLPQSGEWLMASGAERALIERLARDCLRLDDPSLTRGIIVGIQTSADHVFHLARLGPDRYQGKPKGKGAAPYEVAIEDAIMKPLLSGAEAKRYATPDTGTYVLFPYARNDDGVMRLIPADEMQRRFPKAWAHLKRWERELRAREQNRFDHDAWYRFGRNQNIDKQDVAKLVVPRLVAHLKCSLDGEGRVCLDNVDVGGVLPAAGIPPAFLMAVLNGPVADVVFRAIAKPFQNDYRSANRQFIAPLPVPRASAEERDAIAARALRLQARWTQRRELLRRGDASAGVLADEDAAIAEEERALNDALFALYGLSADERRLVEKEYRGV